MATVTRGSLGEYGRKIQLVLEQYEASHSGAIATLYEQTPGAVRVRIVDERFANVSKSNRHEEVFKFLADRLDDDTIEEISILLLLSPSEQNSSFLNQEFDDPIRSHL
jgi:stress-induced morphogen